MRTLSATLEAAQQGKKLSPLVKLSLSRSASTSYTHTRNRIIDIEMDLSEFSQKAKLILDNSDNALDGIDYRAYQGIIGIGAKTAVVRTAWIANTVYAVNASVIPTVSNSYCYKCTVGGTSHAATEPTWPTTIGATVTDGSVTWECDGAEKDEYSYQPPLYLIDPVLISKQGSLTGEFKLIGIPDLMKKDKAKVAYAPTSTDTKTVKTLINALAGATLAGFTHCTAYTVDWDSEDSLIDVYTPKDGFRIYIGDDRLSKIQELLEFTKCHMLVKADGHIHIFVPTITGASYDSQYSLTTGHTFFSKSYRNMLVIPNKVTIQSQADDTPAYTGNATSAESYALKPIEDIKATRLASNAQATAIAEATIARKEMWAKSGSATIPINVGAEALDYVLVTDERQSDTRTGNLGTIHIKYAVQKGTTDGKWEMTFSFGDWLSLEKALDEIGITPTALQNYFTRLVAKDLYAENIQAENMSFTWLDPDGTIDLSKIGDTLDGLANGTTYARVKSTAINASGMILVDQLITGTYGIVLATDISAGHIKLTTDTAAAGKWYDHAGVIIDATNGIILYGSATAFRTRTTAAGTDQCYMDATGAICAGAGAVKLDATGIAIYGEVLSFYYSTTKMGTIYGRSGGVTFNSLDELTIASADHMDIICSDILSMDASLIHLNDPTGFAANCYPLTTYAYLMGKSDAVWLNAYFLTFHSDNILPTADSYGTIGSSAFTYLEAHIINYYISSPKKQLNALQKISAIKVDSELEYIKSSYPADIYAPKGGKSFLAHKQSILDEGNSQFEQLTKQADKALAKKTPDIVKANKLRYDADKALADSIKKADEMQDKECLNLGGMVSLALSGLMEMIEELKVIKSDIKALKEK